MIVLPAEYQFEWDYVANHFVIQNMDSHSISVTDHSVLHDICTLVWRKILQFLEFKFPIKVCNKSATHEKKNITIA
jgi:hypothetical protein